MKLLRPIVLLVMLLGASVNGADEGLRLLAFSKTLMFRHASITNGIKALKQLGLENRFQVDATEDSSAFSTTNLARYRVVVFLSTSGDILSEPQQDAFKHYLESGGGFVGIHAAIAGKVATEGTWPWFVDVMCTEFDNHKAIEQATVIIEDSTHQSTAHLPSKWVRTDEWYNFTASPRGKVHVLASLDEKSFRGGTMGADHPVAWCRQVGKGRLWYTALGHTEASFSEPEFLRHLLGGIQWAGGNVVKGRYR